LHKHEIISENIIPPWEKASAFYLSLLHKHKLISNIIPPYGKYSASYLSLFHKNKIITENNIPLWGKASMLAFLLAQARESLRQHHPTIGESYHMPLAKA
jgi:hypothetical protein